MHGGQTQQSYQEWQKTQKNDGDYNYFFHDRRHEWQDDRRGDQFSRRGEPKARKGQKTYGDVYGQFR